MNEKLNRLMKYLCVCHLSMDTVVFWANRSHSFMLRSEDTVATRWLWGSNLQRVMVERWWSGRENKSTVSKTWILTPLFDLTVLLSYRSGGVVSVRWLPHWCKPHSVDLLHKPSTGRQTRHCRRSAGQPVSTATVQTHHNQHNGLISDDKNCLDWN